MAQPIEVPVVEPRLDLDAGERIARSDLHETHGGIIGVPDLAAGVDDGDEIVGRLEDLRELANVSFGFHAIGYVPQVGDQPADVGIVEEVRDQTFDPMDGSVRADDAARGARLPQLPFEDRCQTGEQRIAVLGMHEVPS